MLPYLFLLFVLMPIVEIAVLLNVGAVIGWLPTIGIVILTAVVGTYMLRQQGLATVMTARERMQAGEMPAQQLLEGMILLVGGALLLTPGFVTDAAGFIALLPPTRKALARFIARRSVGSVVDLSVGGAAGPASAKGERTRRPGAQRAAEDGTIIEGDYRRED